MMLSFKWLKWRGDMYKKKYAGLNIFAGTILKYAEVIFFHVEVYNSMAAVMLDFSRGVFLFVLFIL